MSRLGGCGGMWILCQKILRVQGGCGKYCRCGVGVGNKQINVVGVGQVWI